MRETHGVHLAAQTLAKLAVLGGGPPYFKDGRFPVYPVADLDKFAIDRLGRLRKSTSDDGTAGRAAGNQKAVEHHRDSWAEKRSWSDSRQSEAALEHTFNRKQRRP